MHSLVPKLVEDILAVGQCQVAVLSDYSADAILLIVVFFSRHWDEKERKTERSRLGTVGARAYNGQHSREIVGVVSGLAKSLQHGEYIDMLPIVFVFILRVHCNCRWDS